MGKCLLMPSSSVCVWDPFTDLDDPVVTVHQSIGEAKEQFYYERTVFLRCVANSNPPVRYSWHRGREVLTQGSDKGVEIYEPFFTQVSRQERDLNEYLKLKWMAHVEKGLKEGHGMTKNYETNVIAKTTNSSTKCLRLPMWHHVDMARGLSAILDVIQPLVTRETCFLIN